MTDLELEALKTTYRILRDKCAQGNVTSRNYQELSTAVDVLGKIIADLVVK